MGVEFHDYSIEVKAALDDETLAWLDTWAHETAAQAARNCAMDGQMGSQLRGSYQAQVNGGQGEALVGSPMEAAYWEEFGTGTYAAKGDGRKGWWIYIEGGESGGGGATYATREEAEAMAAYIRSRYGKPAVVTNGRRPAYTLENAFKGVKPKAVQDLKNRLKQRMGGNG